MKTVSPTSLALFWPSESSALDSESGLTISTPIYYTYSDVKLSSSSPSDSQARRLQDNFAEEEFDTKIRVFPSLCSDQAKHETCSIWQSIRFSQKRTRPDKERARCAESKINKSGNKNHRLQSRERRCAGVPDRRLKRTQAMMHPTPFCSKSKRKRDPFDILPRRSKRKQQVISPPLIFRSVDAFDALCPRASVANLLLSSVFPLSCQSPPPRRLSDLLLLLLLLLTANLLPLLIRPFWQLPPSCMPPSLLFPFKRNRTVTPSFTQLLSLSTILLRSQVACPDPIHDGDRFLSPR